MERFPLPTRLARLRETGDVVRVLASNFDTATYDALTDDEVKAFEEDAAAKSAAAVASSTPPAEASAEPDKVADPAAPAAEANVALPVVPAPKSWDERGKITVPAAAGRKAPRKK